MASHLSIPLTTQANAASSGTGALSPAAATAAKAAALPPAGLRRFSWGIVAYNVLVILWGAVVRATGSGNGCGEHWPLCGGTVVQHWRTTASIIEFAHRATSGIAVLAMVVLAGWTWRATPTRHLARVFAAVSLLLTFNEGLLGALLVLLGHTGTDQSPMRAFWLSLHLSNTLLMLACLALTAHFLGRQDGRMRGGVQFHQVALALVGLFATLFVGVSGSLAALGDTLYPAQTLAQAFAQDFSPSANWLLHIRWVHPTLSVVAGAWILLMVAKSRAAGSQTLGFLVAGLVCTQMLLGFADVLLLAPTWLQVLHLFGADLLWVSLVVLTARFAIRPIGCPGGASACRQRALGQAQARSGSAPVGV